MGVSPMSQRDPDTPVTSKAQSIELARRRAEGLSDPTSMIDWSIVRAKLRKQHDK
jgi:hypothetical protein